MKRRKMPVPSSLMGSLIVHALAALAFETALRVQSRDAQPEEKWQLRYKTVGRKGGSKSSNMEMPDLRSLRTLGQDIKAIAAADAQNAVDTPRGAIEAPPAPPRRERFQRRVLFERLGMTAQDARELSFSDLDITFVPPEGVDEDELNSAEKKFYGFQRRAFRAYVMSFLGSYRQMSMERPLIENVLRTQSHDLTGRATFDTRGALVDFAIVEAPSGGDVRELLRRTLEGIGSLPNPPTELFGGERTFTIYYRLKIN